jgi:hypothetical protein
VQQRTGTISGLEQRLENGGKRKEGPLKKQRKGHGKGVAKARGPTEPTMMMMAEDA